MKANAPNDLTIFNAALEITGPLERAAYIDRACGADAALRQKIVSLLAAYENAGDTFDHFGRGGTIKTQAESADSERVGSKIGRYKLLQKIGEGGCGAVYMAEQEEPVRRRVALKIIKLGMDTKSVIARFEAERQALALMDHPNIAKVHDAGATETGRPYFVMELVRGTAITAYCDEKNLSTRERLELFTKVCQAVQHAHQKGIIHRDLKPSNILVSVNDGVAVPKVIDFGIAKATTDQRLTDKTVFTAFEQFIGTPAYMSPEQAEVTNLDVDTRSDIYSLGVLLYELLTGRTPFDPKELLRVGLDEMRRTIREKEPERPSTRVSTLGGQELTIAAKRRGLEAPKLINVLRGDLDWIVMKCLEKDRTRRYETANGLAMDLKRHLSHEPVLARPPSLGYRLQKSFRRNKGVFTAAGIVGLALVMGMVVSSWQAVRATQARRGEEAARLRADESAQVAHSEKERAEQEAQRAENYLYDADMNLAGQALQQNNLGRALSFLNRHRPAKSGQRDLRGWEWRYLWEKCRSDELAKLGEHEGVVQSVSVSPNGQWVATCAMDGVIKIWSLDSTAAGGRLITNLQTGGGPVFSVAFSPDGRWLAAGTLTNGFAVFRAPEWKQEMTVANPVTGSVAFSGDSKLLAVGGEVWSVDTHALLRTLPCRGYQFGEPNVAWLPNSHTLAGFELSNDLYQVSFFDVSSTNQYMPVVVIALGNELGRLQAPATLAFSPDGKQLAIGCWDNIIRIHGAHDWRRITVLTNHTAWVSSVAFSKDGQWLASAAADHSIRVWSTSNWQSTATLRGHMEEVWTVAFTPDDQRLVSGSKDHSVRLWPVGGRPRQTEEMLVSDHERKVLGLSGACPFNVGPSNILTVWDGQTLQVRQRISSYPVANVVDCRPSQDGRLLLLARCVFGTSSTSPLAQGPSSE
jgi:serine/threonine protein kinase/WD40 repeat protein